MTTLSRRPSHLKWHPGSKLAPWLCGSLLAGAACSNDRDSTAVSDCNRACPNVDTTDLSTPPTSFETDVFAIFAQSCNEQLCHGNALGARAGLYLGPIQGASTTDLQTVYNGLLGPSQTAPALFLVQPGAPAQSFLMHKIDACQNSLDVACAAEPNQCRQDCGDPMPPLPRDTYAELSEAQKLVIRRWIAQGAPP